jgi:hypothetical protein
MRYFVRLIIPALIFVGVVYLLTRQRGERRKEDGHQSPGSSDTGAFLVILALGAVVAIATAFALQAFWE